MHELKGLNKQFSSMSQQTSLAEQVQVRTLQGFKAGKPVHYRHPTSQLTAAKHTPWAVAVITSSLADCIERRSTQPRYQL